MSQTIDTTTTRSDIVRALGHAGIEHASGPLTSGGVYEERGGVYEERGGVYEERGGVHVGSLLVYFDREDPQNQGWAWRDEDSSGSLDSFEELLRLAVGRDLLVQWLEAGAGEVYNDTVDENIVELSEAGVALCGAHGLTVDVDSYGCAFCVEHTIR